MEFDSDNDKENTEFLKGELTALSLPEENPEAPDDDYVPEGFDDQEDYLADMRENYKMDVEADQDNRDAALDDKRFVAGEQWDPEVLQQRQGLPCLTLNTLPSFLAQLTGDWRTNKTAVKVLPAENGDKAIADVRSDLIRSIETKSRAERVYNGAFESMVQCGDGAFRVGVQYCGEDVFDQEITIGAVDDCLSVVWDRLSIDPTGRDATRCFVDDSIPKKEFEARWKEADPSTLNAKESRILTAGGWMDSKSVRVTEHWRMIERKRTLVLFKDGTIFDMDALKKEFPKPEEIDAFIEKHGPPVKTRLAPCTYAQMHLVTGYKILAGPYEYKMTRLPIIRLTGRTVSVGDRRIRFGLVRFMKDVVRLRNFWRSVAAEQLGYAPKAQWIAPESAVEGREDAFRQAHKTRDPLLVYNDDAETPPERLEPPTIQSALLNEAQINSQDMKDISGIHDASLGIQSNETSGKAIMARQREGDVASLTYYDNGNAAILEAGDVMNQLIPQIYDATRIIRVIGEDESAKLVNINDPMDPKSPNLATGSYDVAITTGASYTTKRVEAAESMMNAIQVYPELMGIAGDLVIKAQDWPGAEELSERLLKTIPPQYLSDKEKEELGNQPDMQGMMQQQAQVGEQLQEAQQELAKLQQENQTLKIKAAIEAKKIEIEEYKAQTDRLTAYAAIIKDGAEADISALEKGAAHALAVAEHEHSQNMDVANLVQDQVQHGQNLQHTADQADADREAQAAQAAQASNEQNSTPPA
jgi:hypothetical protein